MSLQKSKILLDKINALYQSVAADGKVSAIERDLMLSYLRQMYESFIEVVEEVPASVATATAPTPTPPPVKQVVTPPPPAPVVVEYVVTQSAPKVEVREEPKIVPPPPPVVETPAVIVREEPKVVAPTPPPIAVVIEEPRVVPAASNIFPEPPKPRAAQKPLIKMANERVDQSELFEEKMKKELSDKLGETPIDDIRKGMSLNEKILYMNELFNGNHQEFDDAVNTLNSIGGFDAAKNLLASLSQRFDWASKEKFAKPFIRLVRRRYN